MIPRGYKHQISGILNLQECLDNKADKFHTHDGLMGPGGEVTHHNHEISDINNLTETLAGKADVEHTHDCYALADHCHEEYAASDHNHDAEYATLGHTHPAQDLQQHEHKISEVVGLQNELNLKSNVGHSHTGYALTNHGHPELSPIGHEHEQYALTDHCHEEYALVSHGHLDYAPWCHCHYQYARLDHTHDYTCLCYAPVCHTHCTYAPKYHEHTTDDVWINTACVQYSEAKLSSLLGKFDCRIHYLYCMVLKLDKHLATIIAKDSTMVGHNTCQSAYLTISPYTCNCNGLGYLEQCETGSHSPFLSGPGGRMTTGEHENTVISE